MIDSLNNAISDFSLHNTDPKAQIVISYASLRGSVRTWDNTLFFTFVYDVSFRPFQFSVDVLLFYDAPTPAPGVYDAILAIPSNSSSVRTRTFVDFVMSLGP